VKDIPLIDPHAVYTLDSLTEALRLKRGCLPRECRLRRLRFGKRGGRVYFLGSWVLEWLRDGEVKRPAAAANGARPEHRTT
jgi:hypothetical protein